MERKSKKGIIIVFIIILILLILAVCGYLFLQMSKPRDVFDKAIDKILLSDNQDEFDTIKSKAEFDLNVSLENCDMDEDEKEQLQDEIDKYFPEVSVEFELDKTNKIGLFSFDLTSEKEKIVQIDSKIDVDKNKIYANLDEWFDKTISFDLKDFDSEIVKMLDEDSSATEQFLASEKAREILSYEIKSQLKDEYFFTEKKDLNGEKVNKNTLKIDSEQLINATKNICSNLSQNDEFISCFEDSNSVKNALDDVKEDIESYDTEDDMVFEISIYTKGMKNEFRKLDLSAIDSENDVKLEVSKLSEEEYSYVISSSDMDNDVTGNVKKSYDNTNLEISCKFEYEGADIEFQLSNNNNYNEPISKFKENDTINVEDLSEEDSTKIYENMMNSKLYELLRGFYGDTILEYYNYRLDDVNYSSNDSIKLEEGKVVSFEVPEKFEMALARSEEEKKEYETADGSNISSVVVYVDEISQNDYLADLQKKINKYIEDEYYDDVNIEKQDVFEKDGKEFLRIVITYKDYLFDDNGVFTRESYIINQLNDDKIYVVETTDGYELISDDDIDAFLNYEITEENEE